MSFECPKDWFINIKPGYDLTGSRDWSLSVSNYDPAKVKNYPEDFPANNLLFSVLLPKKDTELARKLEKLYKDIKSQDAVIRRLEIIGEAVKNLPADFKKKKSSIPWQNIAGMRDFLIHEYFGVDLDLVWQTVKKDLPEFKKQILKLLDKSR